MCEPMALIGTALSVAGGLVNAQQQNAAIEAQNRANREAAEMSRRARQAELARQQQFEAEAQSTWNQSLENLTPQQRAQRQDQAEQEFVQEYDTGSQANPDGQYLSGQDQASAPVRESIARQVTESTAEARRRAQALARLSAYGTVETLNNNAITNTNNSLQTLNGLRRGSLGVANFEGQVPAARVNPGSSVLGDILTGAGGLAARAGGTGGLGGTRTGMPSLPQIY